MRQVTRKVILYSICPVLEDGKCLGNHATVFALPKP
jgi:hypothetical protein